MLPLQSYEDDVFINDANSTNVSDTVVNLNELVVGSELGSGGFGSVCECFMRGNKYALKKFHKNRTNDRASRESFESEKTVLHLSHPNIVRTYFTFAFEDTHCVLMEFVSRKTLQNIIDDSNEIIDINRCKRFARDIIAGLAYAHRNNIVHLDLKPANILITATGECKVADFGCCQVVGDTSVPSTPTKSSLTGTYAYRAPELLRGESISTKADIYSFGICLWQMLVRERPFGNEHYQVIIFKVVAYNLRPIVPTASDQIEMDYIELMKRCWDKENKNRPTADEILKHLS